MRMRYHRAALAFVVAAFAGVAQADGLAPLESKLARADRAYQQGHYPVVMDVLQDVFDGEAVNDLSRRQHRHAAGLLADTYWRSEQYTALLAHSKAHQPARVHRVWGCLVAASTDQSEARECWKREDQPNRMLRAIRMQLLSQSR